MTASASDKLKKLARKWVGQIGAAGVSDASTATIPLSSTTNLPTDTAVVATIDRVDANGTKTASLEETVIGVVSGSNLVTCTRGAEGTAQAHAAGAVVEILVTAKGYNDIIDHLLVEHNQDGTHLSSVVTTLTGTQTLTNKTLTSPKIGTNIKDTNGNELITLTATGSAVNEVTLANGATGTGPTFTASGDDTNIDLNLKGKGTGEAKIYNYDDSTYYSAGEFLNSSIYRQAIINGNFDVWQRGTTATITATAFLADRWQEIMALDGGVAPTLTRSRQLLTSGDIANAFYHTRLASNGAGTSIGNSSYHRYSQKIENGTRYLAGNGKTVTVSFYARSNIANKRIGIVIYQRYGSGGSPSATETLKSGPISITSSWAKYTYTFTTNTLAEKTFGTANDDSLDLNIYDQWGTTIGNTEIETSITAEPYASGYIDYAQVQLCAGSVALPFMPKSYEEELRACQRYFIRYGGYTAYERICSTFASLNNLHTGLIDLPVEMRILPVDTVTGNFEIFNGSSTDTTPVLVDSGSSKKTLQLDCTSAGTPFTVTGGGVLRAKNSTSAYIDLSAEL